MDDSYGIDTVYNDSDPMDDSGISHGTAVAGIIGAVGNNGIGVAGVNWQVSLRQQEPAWVAPCPTSTVA